MTQRFSDQDAQTLVNAAKAAPLANMDTATALAAILMRFQAFYLEACVLMKRKAELQTALDKAHVSTTGIDSTAGDPEPNPLADQRAATLAAAIASAEGPAVAPTPPTS